MCMCLLTTFYYSSHILLYVFHSNIVIIYLITCIDIILFYRKIEGIILIALFRFFKIFNMEEDRAEGQGFANSFSFSPPPFLRGKRKGERNNQSRGQKACLSVRYGIGASNGSLIKCLPYTRDIFVPYYLLLC